MLLNELLKGLKDKIKQDLEFGRTYAANVVDQQMKKPKEPESDSAPLDSRKAKIALQNRLKGEALSAEDLAIFKKLTANKDQSISSAATNTLRKLPLGSQDQRVLQGFLSTL